MAKASNRTKLTIPELKRYKNSDNRLTMLTAYDATMARCLDEAGIDLVLVGDSLGMVVQGGKDTTGVSVDDMIYHTQCVRRGIEQNTDATLIVADMPYQAYSDPVTAHINASRLIAEGGADMVKLEGAGVTLESIAYLSQRNIPVCAHLGLTPQSVGVLGGYKVQAQSERAAQQLLHEADEVAEAGASLLVLECIPTALGKAVTDTVKIPTIGIGAGPYCNGQVLVTEDMLGMTSGRKPKFVKNFLAGEGSVHRALQNYAQAVRNGSFPSEPHSYGWAEAHA